MATLFCFIAIVAIIIALCRFEEDDKLLWPFLLSFIGAIAITMAVLKITEDKKSDVVMIENAPTQALQSMPCNFYSLADMSLVASMREKSPKPVSKDSITINDNDTLSEVHVSARGQPFWIGYFDTS